MGAIEVLQENVYRASDLHIELAKAGFNQGCLEVSMSAMGAVILKSDVLIDRPPQSLDEAVSLYGFIVNWTMIAGNNILPGQISDLLEGRSGAIESYPEGDAAGFLCNEDLPDGKGHLMGLLLNPKREGWYWLVDSTYFWHFLPVNPTHLAYMANRVYSQGGQFEISQIKRETRIRPLQQTEEIFKYI